MYEPKIKRKCPIINKEKTNFYIGKDTPFMLTEGEERTTKNVQDWLYLPFDQLWKLLEQRKINPLRHNQKR